MLSAGSSPASTRLRRVAATTAVAAVSTVGLVLGSGAAQAATTLVSPNNLQGFSFSETRTTGHNDFTADGLHVYTEGSTRTDKAAGYKQLDPAVPLSTVAAGADPSLNLTDVTGGKPGYQMAFDKEGDGVPDGYLVGEPDSYGNKWWNNNPALGTVPASVDGVAACGYPLCATLDDISAAYPAATITAIGYSLGSGVKGDVNLKSMTFVDTTYTFGLDPAATGPADLSVAVTGPGFVASGSGADVQVVVTNNSTNPSGPTTATALAPGYTITDPGTGTLNDNGSVTYAVPYLAPGASTTFSFSTAPVTGFRFGAAGAIVYPAVGQQDANLFNNLSIVPLITR